MNRKLLLAAVCLASATAAVTAGCQTYDFQPVEPLAMAQEEQTRDLKVARVAPNIMLLVDKSGSMNQPTNPSLAACQVSGGTCPQGTTLCPANCPTRWSELQSAIGSFFAIQTNRELARFGLATYPTDRVCGTDPTVPAQVRELIPSSDVPGDVGAAASRVNAVIQGIQMVAGTSSQSGTPDATGGGTPTGNSLKQLGALAELNSEREDVILLLTDGLPNCNPNNPNDGVDTPMQCSCTLASCTDTSTRKVGCLDAAGTVAEITALRQRGIRTAVVGLGSETGTGSGPVVLSDMATAGGLARTCTEDAHCRLDASSTETCDTASGFCSVRFYQASNGSQLAAAIARIGAEVTADDPCMYRLTEVPAAEYISVLAGPSEGPLERVAAGPETWRLEPSADLNAPCKGGVPCVVLQGQLCEDVTASSALDPMRIEVRAIYPL